MIMETVYVPYGDQRQSRKLHIVKNEGMNKRQPTGPEAVNSRSTADPLPANPWPLPAAINPFPPIK